ncbi:MAG TPA: phosphate uptake regulator PhoU [Candidatus Aenigmarchaeota archaeon]|nr:phosphate uptake regulator PhoU [Candidatus Aenigmarchaeota archaeon]
MSDLRKVQKTGGSTYIISLPKKWANANGVKVGDILTMVPGERGTLIIDPNYDDVDEPRKKRIVIRNEVPEHFLRRLISVYINGYNVIEIEARSAMSSEMKEAIRRFTRMVIGPEITEESINNVHIKDLLDTHGFGIQHAVKRIYRITYSMLSDSFEAVNKGESDIAKDVVSRDEDVDRLFWLISKQFNLMLKRPRCLQKEISVEESLNYYLVGRILERIADHARNISKHLLAVTDKNVTGKTPLSKQTHKYFRMAGKTSLGMLEGSFDSFIKGDCDLANKTIDRTWELKELYTSGISTIDGKNPKLSVAIAGIMESVKRAGMYASDIAEIAINMMENHN